MVTFKVEPISNSILNIKGWRIVGSDGRILLPFTTRREAEKLIEFFTEGGEKSGNSNLPK